jgi:hypothetical protein
MFNFVKRIAVSAFTAQCILRVYRGPNELTYVDDGSGTGALRPQTNSECVGAAITQGATLAEGTITAIRNGWNGANEQTRQERADEMRKWLRNLPDDWQELMNDMARRRAERNQ